MNIKSKKILIIMIAAMLSLIAMPNRAHAGLQANKGGTSLVKVTANGFFVSMRRMESQYGTLGKSAVFDQTTYVDSTGNGIDSHMALNTEFGTAGILAYSEYGTIPTNSKDTTTGNASGIYQLGYENAEYVAGIYSKNSDYIKVIENADERYFNIYSSGNSIKGDGMESLGFRANYPGSTGSPTLIRSLSGVLYSRSYNYSSNPIDRTYGTGVGGPNISSRAVVVCGAGL